MNSVNSKVILKKLQRIDNINKFIHFLILDIYNGSKFIRPVFKIPDKKTVIDVYDQLIIILNKLNINFAVSNDAPRKGRIGILITIKTKIVDTHSVLTIKANTNANNTTKARAPD